jgi:hypothetical protein
MCSGDACHHLLNYYNRQSFWKRLLRALPVMIVEIWLQSAGYTSTELARVRATW